MKLNEYQNLSKRTLDQDKTDKEMLLECMIGLPEEVGEALGILKKVVFHGHKLDREKLIKELGDVQWYLTTICTMNDITLEEVAMANVDKLKKRYPEGFSAEASINRECEHEWENNYLINNLTNEVIKKAICRKCEEVKEPIECEHELQKIIYGNGEWDFEYECRKCGIRTPF